MDIGAEKLKYFKNKTQLILLKLNGMVYDSCDTLIKVTTKNQNLYEVEPFLESTKETILGLSLNEEVSFPCIGQELLGRRGYFDLIFKKVEIEDLQLIQWIIVDLTEYYNSLIPIQQERNELDIREEFLISQQKALKLEKKLLKFQNEELKRIRKFKEDFFAQVSHEMRTPLNSISGITDLLLGLDEKSFDNSKIVKYLQDLKHTSHHLKSIVDDVLDLSKIESGKIQLNTSIFNVVDTVQSISNSFFYLVNKRGLKINCKIDSDVPRFIEADKQKLTQILFNIVGNSIKYTESGSISINVKKTKNKTRKLELHITVSDTGIGMDKKEVEAVFEPYMRANDVEEKMYEGTGLGMSIVKKLVGIMYGKIQIFSEKGVGTKVSLNIPVNSVVPEKLEIELNSSYGDEIDYSFIQKVIVAEDDPMARKIISEVLDSLSLQSITLSTAEAVLEELNTGYYDLVILDSQLPGINGITAAGLIRNELSQEIPIILVTGEDLDSTSEFINKVIIKPFSIDTLGYAIYELDKALVETRLINPRYLKELTNNNFQVQLELIDIFCRDLPKNIIEMKNRVKNRNLEGLQKILHKTIPNVQYIGISGLDRLMEDLESNLKSGLGELNLENKLNEIEKLASEGIQRLEIHRDTIKNLVQKHS